MAKANGGSPPMTLRAALEALTTGHELNTLTSALLIAIERYQENAKALRDERDHNAMNPTAVRAYDVLAEQFDTQAEDARKLLARVEGGEDEEEGAG